MNLPRGIRQDPQMHRLLKALEAHRDERPAVELLGTSDPGIGGAVTLTFRANRHTPKVYLQVQSTKTGEGGEGYDATNYASRTLYETVGTKQHTATVARDDDEHYYAYLIPAVEVPPGCGTTTLYDGVDGDDHLTFADLGKRTTGTAELEDDAVTTEKIGAAAVMADEIASAAVESAKIAGLSVTASKIAAGAVRSAKLGDASVVTAKLADGAVTSVKIGDAEVGTVKLADGSVTTAKVGAAAVTTSELADGSVTTAKIGAAAVTTSELGDGSVTTAKVGAAAVTTSELGDGAVTTVKIGASQVTTAKLADLAVTGAKIDDATIAAAKLSISELADISTDLGNITRGEIDGDDIRRVRAAATSAEGRVNQLMVLSNVLALLSGQKIGVDIYDESGAAKLLDVALGELGLDTVPTDAIQAAAVTETEVADDSISTPKLKANVVTAAKIAADTITANEISAGTITSAEIAAGTITASVIAAGTITSSEIAAGAVIAGKIAAGAVVADKIAAGAVVADKIAAGAVVADKIAADAVVSAKIAAGAVVTAKIAAGAVVTDALAAGAVTAGKITVSTLDAISADLGTITAGLLQDDDGEFVVDLDGAIQRVEDTQPTPVTRVRLGRLGPTLAEYGIEIRDQENRQVMVADGLGVGVVGKEQVRDKDIGLDQLTMSMLSPQMASSGQHFYALPVDFGSITSATVGLRVDKSAGTYQTDLRVCPFMPATDMEGAELLCNVTGTSSLADIRFVLYADNGGFYPGELLHSSPSTIDTSTNGVKTETVNVPLTGGRVYWIGIYLMSESGNFNFSEDYAGAQGSGPLGGSSAFGSNLDMAYDVTTTQASSTPAAPSTFPGSATPVPTAVQVQVKRSEDAPPQGGGDSGGSGGAASVTLQAPRITSAKAISAEKIVVVLEDRSDDETEWKIYHSTGAGTVPSDTGNTISSTTKAGTGTDYLHEDTGLTEDTQHNYRFVSTDGTSDGSRSNLASVKTLLKVPTSFRVTDPGSGGQLDLSWVDASSANDGYATRYRAVGTETWTEEDLGVGASATSGSLTGLTNGQAYEVQIKATSAGNVSSWTDVAVATPTGSAGGDAPELNTVAWTGTDFYIGWVDNSSDETGYEVWRVAGNSGDPFTDGSRVDSLSAGVEEYTDSGPAAGSGSYRYGVRKKGGASGDQDSGVVTGTAGVSLPSLPTETLPEDR